MDEIEIRTIGSADEERACAEIMSSSEPWTTFGRDYVASLAVFRRKGQEGYVAIAGGEVAGFLILMTTGGVVGFIQSLGVRKDLRRRGIGRALVEFAEERLFKDFPNVFLLCTGRNTSALKFYERLGYSMVGQIPDLIAQGHTEIMLRKSIAPLNEFGDGF